MEPVRTLLVAALLLAVALPAGVPAGEPSSPPAAAQCAAAESPPAGVDGESEFRDDDFAPGLLVFALLAAVVILLLIGVGICLGVVCLVVTAILVTLGIITTSAAAGIAARKPRTGFKVLFLQLGAAAAIPCGVGCACLAVWLLDLAVTPLQAGVTGGLLGLFFGLGLAALFNYVWDNALNWMVARFKRREATPS
jgi:hypothetical protein